MFTAPLRGFTGDAGTIVRPLRAPQHRYNLRVSGITMLKYIAIVALACAACTSGSAAYAATSIPMPEAGFALASNAGSGVDTITTPMPSDAGGGLRNSERLDPGPDSATTHDSAPTDATVTTGAHADHGHAATNADGTPNTTAATHKARGNAHWQSLLPGLMK
jgi:hypothetical protein